MDYSMIEHNVILTFTQITTESGGFYLSILFRLVYGKRYLRY